MRTPNYYRRAKPRVPLNTPEAFEAAHRGNERRLGTYLHDARSRSISLSRDIVTELHPNAAMFLCANNAEARINYARITADHMVRAVDRLPADQKVFWVTLIRREYAVREDEAHALNIHRLKRWTHQILQGCSYVGMVEAALFTNLDVVGAAFKRTVSWHTHSQLWGVSEKQIAQICDNANARYSTLVPGITTAHYRPLKDSEVAGQAYYMSKGQISEYRVWAMKESEEDPITGAPIEYATGRFTTRKRDLRPCDLARMCKVFAGRTLDQLSFAGGDGRAVLHAIRHEALGEFRRFENRPAAVRSPLQRSRP